MANKALIDLGKAVISNKPDGKFSISEMEDAFRKEVAALVCNEEGQIDYYKWTDNKNELFSIMSKVLAEVEPKKLMKVFEQFAEVQRVPQGQKARFTVKRGIRNVKRFITRVALAGVYERVRLDRDYLDVETYAHGGAIYQTMEGFLSGSESLTELLSIFMTELENAIYDDIMTALEGLTADLPAANKAASATTFNATTFNGILAVVSAYGNPVIMTTRAFAQTNLLPIDGWVSDVAREEMRQQGYLGKYLGSPVIILEQSFEDATNSTPILDENIAYIIPAGSMEKPIKVSIEGEILIRNVEREDWSTEMQIYRKLGVAVLNANHIGIYQIA